MFPKQQADDFEKHWRRRKPGSSTALHYASDIRIFFKWAEGQPPEAITVHNVDEFIGWQQNLGRAQGRIRRRLIALRMFYDYLAYIVKRGSLIQLSPSDIIWNAGFKRPLRKPKPTSNGC